MSAAAAPASPASLPSAPPMAMSVDVEEYFQVQAFADLIPRDQWSRWPSRIEADLDRMLELLAESRTRGTFFVLGCVAQDHPSLVRRIAAAGHEIASHGMSHRMITELTPAELRAEATESKQRLEDLTQSRIEGYRAPSYTVGPTTRWALDVLFESGYRYDSSIFPIRGRRYGYPDGPTRPTQLAAGGGRIAEFPLTTLGAGPLRVPVLAGSYLRLLPTWMSLGALEYLKLMRLPAVINVHTWEIDPGQPTVGPSRRRAWTHYARIGATPGTLRRLLARARFGAIADGLRQLGLIDAN
ncbi:MAG: XrtA system polysaccharide deacetylase [Candidatus Eiseniibacteriota bacterium]